MTMRAHLSSAMARVSHSVMLAHGACPAHAVVTQASHAATEVSESEQMVLMCAKQSAARAVVVAVAVALVWPLSLGELLYCVLPSLHRMLESDP